MSFDAKQYRPALIIEAVAGSGHAGCQDGPLSRGQFRWPVALCRFGDSLIVADYHNHTIRQVTGVLEVAEPPAMEDNDIGITSVDFESHAVHLIMTAVQILPKELARLIAQYAVPNGRIVTIAGVVDGCALGEEVFYGPSCVAVDDSDPVVGSRLIIGEWTGKVCSLSFCSGLVTTIAGSHILGHIDGPASGALFDKIYGVAVAPNGTIYVSGIYRNVVRRISSSGERTVTTLIGEPHSVFAKSTRYARSSAECFRQSLDTPCAIALHVSDADWASSTDQKYDTDRDVGVLYVGCSDGVHAFDLTRGWRKKYALALDHRNIAGLAVTEDGGRLFAVSQFAVEMIDTRTGACFVLVESTKFGKFLAGVITDNKETTGRFGYVSGCVIDKVTHSLVMVDSQANLLIRLRGVDV